MNRRHSLLLFQTLLGIAASGVLHAELVTIEPDDYPDRTNLNEINPHVRLRVADSANTPSNFFYVTSNVLTLQTAPTGTHIFGETNVTFWTTDFRFYAGFVNSTDYVSIKYTGGSGITPERGTLLAYDSNHMLVDQYLTAPLLNGQIETMTVSRTQRDIAYVIAYTPAEYGSFGKLDQLKFNNFPSIPEIAVEQPSGNGLVDGAATVGFGSANIGTSFSRVFTIRNIGVGQLTGLSASTTGTHATDFVVGPIGTSSLAPGGSTTVTVTFSPHAAGARTAALRIASNDPDENPFDINLAGSGIGVTPEISVSGNGVAIMDGDTTPAVTDHTDFGAVTTIGATVVRTFTILNTGTATLNLTGTSRVVVGGTNAADFVVTTQPSPSVAAGGSTTFQVRFDPSTAGLRTATLSIANNDSNENPYNFAIKGTGILAPVMDVLGNSVIIMDNDGSPALSDHTDFGSAPTSGATVVRTFTIRNRGSAALNLTGMPRVVVGGTNAADFRVTMQPASPVAAGGTTTFQVTFDPAATGARTATLSIANNDAARHPYNFAIKGTGTAPEMNVLGNARAIMDGDLWPALTDHTDFGSVSTASGTVVRTFTIQNIGTGPLNLTGTPRVVVGGTHSADFRVTTLPAASVAVGGATTFRVTFDPSATGTRTATLSIANNDANENPYDFTIKGTGLATTTAVAATGTDPASADLIPPKTTTGEVWVDGERYLTLTVAKPAGVMDCKGLVEVSGNLTDWFSGRNHTTVLRNDANLLQVRDNKPLTPGAKRYIRLK